MAGGTILEKPEEEESSGEEHSFEESKQVRLPLEGVDSQSRVFMSERIQSDSVISLSR